MLKTTQCDPGPETQKLILLLEPFLEERGKMSPLSRSEQRSLLRYEFIEEDIQINKLPSNINYGALMGEHPDFVNYTICDLYDEDNPDSMEIYHVDIKSLLMMYVRDYLKVYLVNAWIEG